MCGAGWDYYEAIVVSAGPIQHTVMRLHTVGCSTVQVFPMGNSENWNSKLKITWN